MTLFDTVIENADYRNIVLSVLNRFSKSKNLDRKALVDYAIWRTCERYSSTHVSKSRFSTYLWNVAKNLCLKDNKFENNHSSEVGKEPYSGKISPECEAFLTLNELSQGEKDLLFERFVGGSTLKEIAQTRKVSKETIRRQIKKLLRQLS